MRNFILATSMLAGTIIGLGMFGIPYTASKAGFFVGLGYIIVLGAILLFLHLMYGEIVERTNESHRLTGYAEKYLGKKWKNIVGAAVVFGIYISLLAYIIVGGRFLSLISQGFADSFTMVIIFWFILSFVVWRGVKTIAWVELLMTGPLILFILFIFFWGMDDVSFQNFTPTNFSNIFLPYGVVLFALSGALAIPEIRDVLKADGKVYKRAIIAGSLIPAGLYILFTFLVVGISGEGTSAEALEGLVSYLGPKIIGLGALLGVLAIATSYLVLASNLKNTFARDWNMKGYFSGALATFVPIALFLVGFQQFIAIISIAGALIGASIGISILAIYLRTKRIGEKMPSYSVNTPKFIVYALMALFALGGVYELIYLIW